MTTVEDTYNVNDSLRIWDYDHYCVYKDRCPYEIGSLEHRILKLEDRLFEAPYIVQRDHKNGHIVEDNM